MTDYDMRNRYFMASLGFAVGVLLIILIYLICFGHIPITTEAIP